MIWYMVWVLDLFALYFLVDKNHNVIELEYTESSTDMSKE